MSDYHRTPLANTLWQAYRNTPDEMRGSSSDHFQEACKVTIIAIKGLLQDHFEECMTCAEEYEPVLPLRFDEWFDHILNDEVTQ